MIIRYTHYKNSFLATMVSVIGNLMYAGGAFFIISYVGNLDGMREETSFIETLIAAAIFGAVGFGLNKLAERIAVNKEKKKQKKADEMVREGVCPNCGSDMKGMDVCARCGYVVSLGERPTEWEEEGQRDSADDGVQE